MSVVVATSHLPAWPSLDVASAACTEHKAAVDPNLVADIAGKFRITLNQIEHKPKDMKGFRGTNGQYMGDVRNNLILSAAIRLASKCAEFNHHPLKDSDLSSYISRARINIANFKKYGVDGQTWGDIMLRTTHAVDMSPGKLLGNFEGAVAKLESPYEFDAPAFMDCCKSSPGLIARTPDSTFRRFEWMLVLEEVMAHRSKEQISCAEFKKRFRENVIKNSRSLTNSEYNFFLRLAALELCQTQEFGVNISRPVVERAIVAALGHEPDNRVIRRIHYAGISDFAELAAFYEMELQNYGSTICDDGRTRWRKGDMPHDLGTSPTELFLPHVKHPLSKEDKQELLESMALAGAFKEYRLETLDS